MHQNSNLIASAPTWEDLGFREEILNHNLICLNTIQPEIAEMLAGATIHDRLTARETSDGGRRVHLSFRRALLCVEESELELRRTTQGIPGQADSKAVLLVGAGTGERAWTLAEALPDDETLWVYDSDPGLLTLTLASRDWAPLIDAGRVRFLQGCELRITPLPAFRQAFLHPLMGTVLAEDWTWVRRNLTSGRTTRAVADERTITVVRGELLQNELVSALEADGESVSVLDTTILTRKQIARELGLLGPAALLGVNFEPELAEICGALAIPYLAWEIDPTASALPAMSPDHPAVDTTHVFTWRRGRIEEFRSAGHAHVEHLPIACDTDLRRPAPGGEAVPIAFVGSCMERHGRYLLDRFTEAATADTANTAAWSDFLLAIHRLEDAIRTDPCRSGVEASIRHELDVRGLPSRIDIAGRPADVIILVGESLSSTRRREICRRLVDHGLAVWGEEDWRTHLPAKTYRGPAGHDETLNTIFSSATVNLDMNRAYQPDIVNLRVFEIIACGGFVLTERTDDLPGLFEDGVEIATYGSMEELIEMSAFYGAHPEERQAIIDRGRERLLREHTVRARLRHMLAGVRSAALRPGATG